jgi:hypothetical protein
MLRPIRYRAETGAYSVLVIAIARGAACFGGLVLLAALSSTALSSIACAQPADDVQAAATAFAQGQRAQLRRDYAQAAELFEVADQAAPSPQAIRSAIRNHREAGHRARAATLAALALARETDPETRTLAEQTLSALRSELALVRVRCRPACGLALDRVAVWHVSVESLDVYVDPGMRRIVATWTGRSEALREVELAAGSEHELTLEPEVEPPPVEEPIAEPVLEVEPEPRRDTPPPSPRGGVHPALFGVLTGLTAVGLGLTIWSGIDTLAARDVYVENPTRERYDAGVELEWRTNGILFSTVALGIATFVTAFFTDWGSGALVAFAPTEGGALAFLSGEIDP